MSTFYGTIQGARTAKTATGSKESGVKATAQSYDGSISVELDLDSTGTTRATISAGAGSTSNPRRELWCGPLVDLLTAPKLFTDKQHAAEADAYWARRRPRPVTACQSCTLETSCPVGVDPARANIINCDRYKVDAETAGKTDAAVLAECRKCTGLEDHLIYDVVSDDVRKLAAA